MHSSALPFYTLQYISSTFQGITRSLTKLVPDSSRTFGAYSLTGTLIEISPVLLFSPEEYQVHGKHTKLDTYTFLWRWKNGEKAWALALGLGMCSSARISMTLF